MKRLLFTVSMVAMCLMFCEACGKNKNIRPDIAGIPDMQPEVETVQMPNPSNKEFLKAITAFSMDSMKAAARYIRRGKALLKEELAETKGVEKPLAEKMLNNLQSLAEQVEQGKIRNENVMVKGLAHAEAVAAHNYIFRQGKYNINNLAPNLTVQHIDTLRLLLQNKK